ncbi:MAG TPA: cytochrome C oxidase subunit IV family protein [Labilithrix sp.]|jgi:cytochrome c oxidase subunit 4
MNAPKPTSILATSIALLVLWIASWLLSSFELGRWAMPVALAIATTKASLVALIFMELAHARASVRLVAVAAAAMVGLLIALVVLDVASRTPG